MYPLIALVLTLALGGFFAVSQVVNLGSIFNDSSLDAVVEQKRKEGDQLLTAVEMYLTAHLYTPPASGPEEIWVDLVPMYLSSAPKQWDLGNGYVFSPTDKENLCEAYNLAVTGSAEIRECSTVEADMDNTKFNVCCTP